MDIELCLPLKLSIVTEPQENGFLRASVMNGRMSIVTMHGDPSAVLRCVVGVLQGLITDLERKANDENNTLHCAR